jgi:uncharacterized membrane protein
MPIGSITIMASPWLWVAGGMLLTALAVLVWSYQRASAIGVMPRIAFGLKLLGITALALCLVEPLWSGRQARPGANLFAVVADNSSGMNIHDGGSEQSRAERLRDLLQEGNRSWLAALSENFEIRQYAFDSRLRRTTDFNDLTFDGTATALRAAFKTLGERYAGRPLAGVLLLTDGCATDADESLSAPAASPFAGAHLPPVYPVPLGRGRPPKDLAVESVTVSQTSFEDAPVTIQAEARATGFAGRSAAVELRSDLGEVIEHRQWDIDKDDQEQVFRFRLRPDKTGVLFYELRVGSSHDSPPSEGTPDAQNGVDDSEATLANNSRTVVVHRGKGPYRILYVSGRPNWEYKFLRRAVEQDEQVELVGLLRVARREPRYDWRGHRGETSNPLYRGFDRQDPEQAEQYDQPVLVRLNTRDEAELRDGFPKTPQELFEYHAVILDDVEAEFFSYDQMDLLRRFVAERGGGFLMLGGKESFQRGGFQHTPIGNLLPVYLDPVPGAPAAGHLRVQLTREGWLQPWVRLRDNEQAEQQRLAEMPEFRVFNRLRAVKPGAGVMATSDDTDESPLPVLVVQQFGNGRTAALAAGDLWRWGLQRPEARDDMEKFWRQALRWLIADVPDRLSLQARHKPQETNQPIALQVRVHNKAFEPVDDVSVSVEVREPGDRKVLLTAVAAPSATGLFEATYIPRSSGGYVARALVSGAADSAGRTDETGWTVDLQAAEFRSVAGNRPLLESIARQTGGRIVEAGELSDFVRDLPRRDAPITDVVISPLWNLPGILPALLVFILTCFVAEWALRRGKGMP